MAISNRAALLNRTIKILKKYYTPAAPAADRPLLEHLLFACCLENSTPAAAQQVFTDLEQEFFDWNEVRVSSIRELAEVMQPLSDPEDAARRVRGVLQSVFESFYAFDLEELKKLNISQAVKKLQSHDGVTPFAISYVVQAALGGHAIPINEGTIRALVVIGAVSGAEAEKGRVPGLERAVSKSKGIEAGSLLQQWGADFRCHPFASATRKVLLEIAPDCKQRLPKRPSRKSAKTPPSVTATPEAKKAGKTAGAETARSKTKSTADKKKTPAKKKKTTGGSAAGKKKTTAAKPNRPAATKKDHAKKKPPGKRISKRKPR